MPFFSAVHRPRARLLTGLLSSVVLTIGMAGLTTSPAAAEVQSTSTSSSFTLKGSGYGHGYGMSQYGAYGAARAGKTWKQILAFYYPGTTLGTMASGTRIKVWVTADDASLGVLPSTGLRVEDNAGKAYPLPTGSKYRSWRITRSGSSHQLSYKSSDGRYHSVSAKLGGSPWSFHDSDHLVKLMLPNGTVREYRGSLYQIKSGSSARTVNRVLLEDYVRSVVPSEMPTSWATDAVRTQAVAARSYAVRLRDNGSASGYDICDTTACQVYAGLATTRNGSRVVRETVAGNAAVQATAGTVVRYRGAVALTQFASSNGGHTAQGGYPYLSAHPDPYDDDVKSQDWRVNVSAKQLAKAWPAVGTVSGLRVTARDGEGAWGGRASTIRISGSRGSVTVSGNTFKSKLSLRSTLFTVS